MDRLSDSGLKTYLASLGEEMGGVHFSFARQTEIVREKGTLKVRGSGSESLLPLARRLHLCMKGGVLPQALGVVEVSHPLRVVDWLGEEVTEEIAYRILELGFNSVVSEEGREVFERCGLKVMDREQVKWEEGTSQGDTPLDGVLKFLREVEGSEVIVEVTASGPRGRREIARHIEALQDGCRRGIHLSFAGDEGHSSLHPIWSVLHASPDLSGTPLLPTWNVGLIDLGEGLWPLLPLASLEEGLNQHRRHRFSGALVQLRRLPRRGTLLDGLLFAFGHALWSGETVTATWELWNRGEAGFTAATQNVMKRCDTLARQLRAFQRAPRPSEQGEMIQRRAEGEALLAQLNLLQLNSGEGIPGYHYFLRDAKKYSSTAYRSTICHFRMC